MHPSRSGAFGVGARLQPGAHPTIFLRDSVSLAMNGVLERLAFSAHSAPSSRSIAYPYPAKYHERSMNPAPSSLLSHYRRSRKLALAILALVAGLCFALAPPLSAQSDEILPLSQVQPGMHGYAYTIFAGDQVEKFDLEVIGVMPNFLGPRQSIILIELKGPKVEHTGVVAGMSGSPVYLNGKLAGALSLKLGVFTKEAIAGVTPIEDILHPAAQDNAPASSAQQLTLPNEVSPRTGLPSGSSL